MSLLFKFLIWICCIIVIVFLLMAAIFPYWLSSSQGTRVTTHLINEYIAGHLSVEKIQLNWFGKQQISGFALSDSKGQKIASFKHFETESSLIYLLFGGKNLKKTALIDPYLFFEEDDHGENNIAKVLKEKNKKKFPQIKKQFKFPLFDESFFVKNGTFILASPKISPITISEIEINKKDAISLEANEKLHFYLTAKTQQKEAQGTILVDANFSNQMCVQIKITDFPVEILDQFQEKPFFTQSLGPSLNAYVNLVCEKDKTILINGEIESANVKAQIDGQIKDKILHLNSKTRLLYIITPAFFKNWIIPNQKSTWDLANKTEMFLKIDQMTIPLKRKIHPYDITLQAQCFVQRAEVVHPKLGSYSLNQFEATLISVNNIEITYFGNLQGKETSQLEGSFSIMPNWDVLYKWNYIGFPVSILELFSPDVSSSMRNLFGPVFNSEGEGTYQSKKIEAAYQLTAPHSHLQGTLNGPLENLNCTLKGNLSLYGDKATYLGSTLQLDLNANANFGDKSFALPSLSGTLSNTHLTASMEGSLGQVGKPFSYQYVNLDLKGDFHAFPLQNWIPNSTLEAASFEVKIEGEKKLISGQIEAVLQSFTSGGQIDSSPIDITLSIKDWLQDNQISWNRAFFEFNGNCASFPITSIQRLFATDINLPYFFGSYSSLKAHGTYSKDKPFNPVSIDAKGENFSAQFAVNIDGTLSIQPEKPAYLHWIISPQQYETMLKFITKDSPTKPTFSLIQPVSVDLKIEHLICPKEAPKKLSLFLCQSGFVGNLNIGMLAFKSPETKESLILQNIKASIKGENFSEAINLDVEGTLFATNIPQTQKAGFSFTGQMLNFWTPDGKFNRQGLTVRGGLNLDLIPVRELTGVLPLDEKMRQIIQAVLGDLVNARISGEISQLSGPLNIDIKASNLKALLPLQLEPHALLLNDYVDAEITLTAAVNETLLKDINPLLITGAYSDHPIKVYIDPQNFILPIHPFSFRGIRIDKAIVDIGKITVKNGGQIQSLMQFLKAKEVSEDGTMEAWFTPIFISLNDGVSTYKRFDALLAGSVHIALWGKIDLNKERVHMTLGIAPRTLQQRFHILGLTKKDMFQVKMRGTTDKLDLDWTSAYTRIGLLIARTAGGHIGYIVGGIVEQIVSALGEEPAPPPTTDPFPWEKDYTTQNDIPKEAPPKEQENAFRKVLEFLIP